MVCEDGGDRNFLRGLTRRGELFDIAQNRIAGPAQRRVRRFDVQPDGRTLFVNIQARKACPGDLGSVGPIDV